MYYKIYKTVYPWNNHTGFWNKLFIINFGYLTMLNLIIKEIYFKYVKLNINQVLR